MSANAFSVVRSFPPGFLAAFVAMLVGHGSAWAEPTILVVPYQSLGKGVPPELTEQTTVVVAEEIKAAGLSVIRADEVVDAPVGGAGEGKGKNEDGPVGSPEAFGKAQDILARAKLAMEESEFAAAIKHLKNAIKLLEDNGDAIADLRALPEAYLQLAVAHFRDSDEDAADEALTKAVHYAPDRKLEETEYPPIFIRVYDRARYNVLHRPRARVEVKAKPGANLLFDGRNLGKTPIVLKEALPGTHWIRIERAGEPVQVKKLMVRSKRTVLVEFSGAEGEGPKEAAPQGGLAGAITKNEIQKAHIDMLREVGKAKDADFAMFGGMYKTATSFNIYTLIVRVKDGGVGRLVDVAFDLDMLSAQIEVYKLAEDAKKQASGEFTNPESRLAFELAPKLKLPSATSKKIAKEEIKVQTVAAAPDPINPPEAPKFAADGGAVAGGGGTGGGRDPAGSGATPVAVAAADGGGGAAGVVPKDESDADKGAKRGSMAGTTVTVPVDGSDDREEESMWWIWVIVGVAVAAAAGTTTGLILGGQTPEEGTLRIQW